MAATATIADNFNDNSTDTAKWNAFGTYSETSSKVTLSYTSGSANYSGYTSVVTNFDLTGSYAYCQLTGVGNQALVTFQALPVQVIVDANNSVSWYVSNNALVAQKQVANVYTDLKTDVTYDSSVHKYFRIRESGGTIFWDYSTDAVTWTNYTSLANPFAITSVKLQISAGAYGSEASSTSATFDNFNTTGQSGGFFKIF